MAEVVTLKGLPELLENMKKLPVKLRSKLLRRSLGAGAQVVKKSAAANITKITKTGTLGRSLLIKFIRERSDDTQVVEYVTFRRGKKFQKGAAIGKNGRVQNNNRDAFYAAWVEFGHKVVPRASKVGRGQFSGRSRGGGVGGTVRGRRTLTEGFNSSNKTALGVIENTMRDGFEEAVR